MKHRTIKPGSHVTYVTPAKDSSPGGIHELALVLKENLDGTFAIRVKRIAQKDLDLPTARFSPEPRKGFFTWRS